eukprot:scaffold28306_cov69-Cyclotella_meneghiniana.AAC.1
MFGWAGGRIIVKWLGLLLLTPTNIMSDDRRIIGQGSSDGGGGDTPLQGAEAAPQHSCLVSWLGGRIFIGGCFVEVEASDGRVENW